MTEAQARTILANPSAYRPDLVAEAQAVTAPIVTLEDEFGCDPWDDEHIGKHPASAAPARVAYARRW